jgi:hypothetical protein
VGDPAAATLSEIEASRARLASDIDALAARIPEQDELAARARRYGGAAAGAGVGLAVLVVLAKRRSRARDRERHARDTARFLAEMVDTIPVEATARVEHRSSPLAPLALAAALAGLGVSIANGRRARG